MSKHRQATGTQVLDALLRQAVGFHQAGQLAEAERSYRDVLRMAPQHFDALHLLGVLLHQQGDSEGGLRLVERSLKIQRKFPVALNSKGVILGSLKRYRDALASFDLAIQIMPDYAAALHGRGNMLHELGRYEEAVATHGRAIMCSPDFSAAYFGRARSLNHLGRHQEALADHARALTIQPAFADAWFDQANTLSALDRAAEAVASYDRAIALRPDHAEALHRRGLALHGLGRVSDAIASVDRALAIRPDDLDALNDRGVMLIQDGNYADAITTLTHALAISPNCGTAWFNLASAQYETGAQYEALASLERYLAIAPADPRARVLKVRWTLPIVYRSDEEVRASRAAYAASLRSLSDACDGIGDPGRFADGVSIAQPFYLTYQGYDDRDLQRMYGSLVCRIMADRYGPPPPRNTGARAKIRVGIVSGYFRRHVVWRIPIRGWVTQLDRRRFEVFAYYTEGLRDADTQEAAAACDRFIQGPMSVEHWRQAILSDAPDVLIYPEVGMDPMSARLAAQRLAPVQCNSWGHPDTSGFPTLDYYLSGDAMEPLDGQSHYTEQLVRLPNMGVYYEPRATPDEKVSRSDLGLDAAKFVFWCGQSLYKYLPRYDYVFPRIARGVANCQFAFIAHHGGARVTNVMRERLSAAFDALGMDTNKYCVFLPRMDEARFLAAIGQSDAVLDSIGWSGCNSTLESMTSNLPIISMAGALMRGRHTSAMLGLIGADAAIAATPDEYIDKAIRLARDADWRDAMGRCVANGKQRLFRDSEPITALEEFLERVCREAR